MLEVLVLAIALSMDAFAVSIGLGAKYPKHTVKLSLTAAVYFGLFQGVMPFMGYYVGKSVLGWFSQYAPIIACVILVLLGAKMLKEAFSNEHCEDDFSKINHKTMFVLAIATSIDAIAAGFALNLLPLSAVLSCLMIGVTTFIFSGAGVFLGKTTGTVLENKAEVLGGVVLILIGLKMGFV